MKKNQNNLGWVKNAVEDQPNNFAFYIVLMLLFLLQTAKHIESVILQALDEENNFVRAIATILHSRQNFGHLTFDISETNDTFSKTLEHLAKCQPDSASKVPLLAEFLNARVINASDNTPTKMEETNGLVDNSCLGFRLRGKPPALQMKDAYLDRLQDECERRRVHVPIPGRSFSKQDSEDSQEGPITHHETPKTTMVESGFVSGCEIQYRRAPSFPRRTALTKKEETITRSQDGLRSPSGNPSMRAKLLQQRGPHPLPHSSQANGAFHRRPVTNDRPPNSFRLTTAGQNRSSGIMMLDIADLPAVGLKAKKLRKGKPSSKCMHGCES